MKFTKEDNCVTFELELRISSENSSKIRDEIFTILNKVKPEKVILDCANLEYISSAGLRVILEIGKSYQLSIINVSRDVYEILDISGFTGIFSVKKIMRSVSAKNLKLVGVGASSRVYKLDNDSIIKVFLSGVSLDRIYNETESAKKSFIAGIPTAIPYDVVKCEDGYATIFEMLDGCSLNTCFMYEPKRFDELCEKYTNLLKQFHSIKAKPGEFPDVREKYHKWMEKLTDYMTQEEVNKILDLFDTIPECDSMLHVDPHGGNIMVSNGELMFIDMADIAIGHPLIDVGTEYFHYMILKDTSLGSKLIFGVEPEDKTLVIRIWDELQKRYFTKVKKEDREDLHKLLKYFGCLRCLVIVAKHAQLPYEEKMKLVEMQRKEFMPYIDEAKKLFASADKYFI